MTYSDPHEPTASLTTSFHLPSKTVSRAPTEVESPAPHLGWHSRGYLPHWDHPGTIQSINIRLADSLPHQVQLRWRSQLDSQSRTDPRQAIEHRRRLEQFLDAGHGACWLRQPEIARVVQDTLLHFDGERYRLLAWCIMPNHVHVLIETFRGHALPGVIHSWKSYTSTCANKLLLRRGPFWQREYLDRYVRNAEHYEAVRAYIEENPVIARLVQTKTDWPWSSARWREHCADQPPPGTTSTPARHPKA